MPRKLKQEDESNSSSSEEEFQVCKQLNAKLQKASGMNNKPKKESKK
jgi:hypothetical protein